MTIRPSGRQPGHPDASGAAYQPRTASRSSSGTEATLRPRIGAPRPRETSATMRGSSKCVVAWTMAVRRGRRVLRLEDAGADEDALGAELHRQGRVGRRRDAAGHEVDDRQPAVRRHARDERVRCAELLGGHEQLVRTHGRQGADAGGDGADVAHRLDDVAGAGLALGAHHRGALVDATQRLAEVARAADERHLEGVLVDVVDVVRGREHLGLVDVVDAERLEHLRLDEVADACLGHDRDGHRVHDGADERRVAHARHPAGRRGCLRVRARAP